MSEVDTRLVPGGLVLSGLRLVSTVTEPLLCVALEAVLVQQWVPF
jgi:hypothetical protein